MADTRDSSSPQDDAAVALRIQMMVGGLTLDDAIKQHGWDEVIRALGLDAHKER